MHSAAISLGTRLRKVFRYPNYQKKYIQQCIRVSFTMIIKLGQKYIARFVEDPLSSGLTNGSLILLH